MYPEMKHQILTQPGLITRNSQVNFSTKIIITVLIAVFFTADVSAQAVSGIITDYNGYWKSSTSAINSIKPVNSHNLLAFNYNNIQYSTGVNDQALTSHGESFVASDFWSLPGAAISGAINSNTKVGVGEMYDGIHNGAGNPAPSNDISFYLTDGIKGLNIGTGIANLPAGTMSFNVNSIKPQNIGDGIPDILVTQIADPSGSTDSYSFTNSTGTIIGHKKDIVFTSILPVASWTADFYEASANPMTLSGGYTNTDRDIRVWAADLSDFGITAANYQDISKFTINLSGNSDVAFVGYNNKTFSFATILPVKLSDFSAKAVNKTTQLNWTTETEENTSSFIIERSTDGTIFAAIGKVTATGYSSSAKNYSSSDKQPANGINYYRLKTTDADGKYEYSKVLQIQFSTIPSATAGLYPNPCKDNLVINHPAGINGKIIVYTAAGIAVLQITTGTNSHQTKINVQQLQTGLYYAVWQNGTEKISMPVIKS